MLRQTMKDLLLRVYVVARTSNLKIKFHVVVWQTTLKEKCVSMRAARAARLFFIHTNNDIIEFRRLRCSLIIRILYKKTEKSKDNVRPRIIQVTM